MKWKRFIAKLLVAATIFTSLDLYYVDLSGAGKVLAATYDTSLDAITDAYKAWDDLDDAWKSMEANNFSNESVANEMDVQTRTSTSFDVMAAQQGVPESSWTNSSQHVRSGIYTFNQQNIRTTAQIKSGRWFDDTTYEAMQGTPTTEPLFVTFGGSQWLVDLQYKFITSPYERTYLLRASTPNYRYYRVAYDSRRGPDTVDYTALLDYKYNEEPNEKIKYTVDIQNSISGAKTLYNYAYLWFEDKIDDRTIDDITTTVSITNITNQSKSFKVYKKDGWDDGAGGFTSSEVAPVSKNVSGVSYNSVTMGSGTNYVTPNVARAVMVKQQVYEMLQDYQEKWSDSQDDNYRADQGSYDTDLIHLDSDDELNDELSFMFTYGGMARYGTVNGTGQAGKGNLFYSKSMWYPAITTYLYDWNSYYKHNDMNSTYGSTTPKPRLASDAGFSKDQFYNEIAKSLANEGASQGSGGTNVSNVNVAFPLYYEDLAMYQYLKSTGATSEFTVAKQAPVALDCAEEVAKLVGSDVCIAISKWDDLIAYGLPLKESYGVNSTLLQPRKQYAEHLEFLTGEWSTALPNKAYVEELTLYYRSIYSLLLNYGCFFYYDEMKDLMESIGTVSNPSINGIGFPYNMDKNTYNKHVNACLAAYFGQGNYFEEDQETFLPLAIFPTGGDLDGPMDHDEIYHHGIYYLNSNAGDKSVPQLLSSGLLHPTYVYNIRFKVMSPIPESRKLNVTSGEFYYLRHNGETSRPGHQLCTGVNSDGSNACSVPITCDGTWDSTTNTCTKTITCSVAGTHFDYKATEVGDARASLNNCNYNTHCAGSINNSGWTQQKDASGNNTTKWKCNKCGTIDTGTLATNPARAWLTKKNNGTAGTPSTYSHVPHTSSDCPCGGHKGESTPCSATALINSAHHTHYNTPDSGVAIEDHADRSEKYVYKITVQTEGTSGDGDAHGVNNTGTPSEWHHDKYLKYDETFKQTFNNVQWLEIQGYSIWQIDHGSVTGTNKLLCGSSNIDNAQSVLENEIITRAVDQLGYTVFRQNSSATHKSEGTLTNPYTNGTIWMASLPNADTYLDGKGIVQNSFKIGSLGETDADPKYYTSSTTDSMKDDTITGTMSRYPYTRFIYKHDVPKVEGERTLINDDNCSFYIERYSTVSTSDGDIVSMTYKPLTQGGRSHSTFYGFVNQALAHTFYWADSSDSKASYSAAMDKMSYSNSLRVQGDYLTLDGTDGNKLTLVGMYYNTWLEHYQGYEYAGGKFSLLPAGFNELSIYDSSCMWIPARMSVILNRADRKTVMGNEVNCITDCWVIHSFSECINGGTHVSWDSLAENTGKGDSPCKGSTCNCTFGATHGNPTDKGCVNPYCGYLSNISVTHNTSGLAHLLNDYYYRRSEVMSFNTSKAIKLKDVLLNNVGFYSKFNYTDINGNVIGKAVNIGTENTSINIGGYDITTSEQGVIHINLNWYLAQGLNTETIMTDSVLSNRSTTMEQNMPYIGYHGTKDGIHDITLTESSTTQKGYTAGPQTLFNMNNAFVNTSLKGSRDGFWRLNYKYDFSVTQRPPEYVSGKHNSNQYTSHTFSKNYPWLSGLNVNRYMPNNYYNTGKGTVHYSKMDSWTNGFPNGYSPYQSTDWSETTKKFNTFYEMQNNNSGGAVSGNNVNNGGAGGYLNGIVIYNPMAVQSAHVVTPSENLPDAANKEFTLSGSDILFGYVKRDTRLEYKYNFTEKGKGEQYMSGSGIQSKKIKTSTIERYVPKDVSTIETMGYTENDYEIGMTTGNYWFTDDHTSSYYVKETRKYNMTTLVNSVHYTSSSVDLIEGDIVKFAADGNAVVVSMGTNNFDLDWSAFTDAYKSLQTTTENEAVKNWTEVQMNSGLPLFNNMGMTVGIGANMQLRAGSLIKIALTVSDTYEEGHAAIADALELDTRFLPNIEVHAKTRVEDPSADRVTYEWYLEATDLTYITGLTFNVTKDCFLWRSENIWTNEDVVLMCISSDGNDSSVIQDVTSYGFFYEHQGWDVTTRTTRNFYNNTIVDIRGEWEIQGISAMTVAGFYMCGEASLSSVVLKSEALENPHKVANTDWRYYVLGWATSDGTFITSPVDPKLWISNTELTSPSGLTITVGEIRSKIVTGGFLEGLGVYMTPGGEYGLIDIGDSGNITNRSSRYTGTKVTEGTFAIIQFDNEDITEHTGKAFHAKNPFAAYGITVTNAESKRRHAFECVFYATDGKNATEVLSTKNCAYDVAYSWFIGHRWDTTVDINLVKADWDTELVPVYDFSSEDYNAVFASTLSLDDEYTIYWDNYSDLIPTGPGTTSGYLALTSTSLGRGWDSVTASTDIQNVDYWKAYFKGKANADKTLTDTTKWIYSKYVVFNVDMYAFTTGASFVYDDTTALLNTSWDPTTPAFKEDGTPNNIVYIPAGQRVHLGKYTGNGEGPCDDTGRFVDFGANKNYTYHFWVPLSDGESDDNVVAEFCVNAINGVENTQNNNGASKPGKSVNFRPGINPVTYTALKSGSIYPQPVALVRRQTVDGDIINVVDEWGKNVYNAHGINMDNNVQAIASVSINSMSSVSTNKTIVYTRPNNAYTSQVMSYVGRVGGLTIMDSGDPRYQDTFKLPATDAEWAIAPIVKLIEKFSNVKGQAGSQKKYLTDFIDIRGRWLTTLYANTTYKTAISSDTYAAASWVRKMTSETERTFLPLSSEFNDHEEIKNSVATSKLGYEVWCSLDTTGNFYGSSGKRPDMSDDDYVNNNLDYGQSKVQVHPMYVAFIPDADGVNGHWEAVDVYMRKGTSYILINAGSMYASASEAKDKDAGPYYLESCWDATYTSKVQTNTGGIVDDAYVLDQSILRRSITQTEADITYDVVHKIASGENADNVSLNGGITTSILDANSYDGGGIGGAGLTFEYIYGNAQMLFLREFNRTFFGGTTLALNQTVSNSSHDFIKATVRNAQKYAQRWYFGLGLPSSTVFVLHGQKPTENTILNGRSGYYVLTVIDVYAIGEKWALHYESPVSGQEIIINNVPYSQDKWNVYKDRLPYNIPVSIYDMSDTPASGDLDTRGSH